VTSKTKISNKKRWLWFTLAFVTVFVLTTFKVEDIGEVCGKTGSSIRYNRYFSVFTTEKHLTPSWVEEVLNQKKIILPDREWHKTVGNTSTIFTSYRGHESTPATYILRAIDLEWMHEEFGTEETLSIAKSIAFGDNQEQQDAINRIKSH